MSLPLSASTRFRYQHESLLNLIEGFSDEQIRRNIFPGKWSIFENMVHLQTYQHHFINRVKQILKGTNPHFSRYNAESDPLFYDNCNRPTDEIIEDMFAVRKKLADEIEIFKEEDFHKTAEHPFYGKMDLLNWLNFFLLHEAHHHFAIFKLAAELRKESE
jgi:uncharacterized damage-inducible protein DinB